MTELTMVKEEIVRESRSLNQSPSPATGYIDSILMKLSEFQADHQLGTLCLGITSCDRKVGVSTLVYNIALNAGAAALPEVLVLDANHGDPSQHQFFRLKRGPGMVDHLVRGEPLENCLHSFNCGQINVMMWGSNRIPLSAVSPLKLDGFFSDLRTRFAMIIVDMPAVQDSEFGTSLASHVDGIVLVLDGNRTRKRTLKRCLSTLEQQKATVLGTVMNRYKSPVPSWLRAWF